MFLENKWEGMNSRMEGRQKKGTDIQSIQSAKTLLAPLANVGRLRPCSMESLVTPGNGKVPVRKSIHEPDRAQERTCDCALAESSSCILASHIHRASLRCGV